MIENFLFNHQWINKLDKVMRKTLYTDGVGEN